MSTKGEFPATTVTGLPERMRTPGTGPMIEGKSDSEKDSWLLSLEFSGSSTGLNSEFKIFFGIVGLF
jgi:hypothetical protein